MTIVAPIGKAKRTDSWRRPRTGKTCLCKTSRLDHAITP